MPRVKPGRRGSVSGLQVGARLDPKHLPTTSAHNVCKLTVARGMCAQGSRTRPGRVPATWTPPYYTLPRRCKSSQRQHPTAVAHDVELPLAVAMPAPEIRLPDDRRRRRWPRRPRRVMEHVAKQPHRVGAVLANHAHRDVVPLHVAIGSHAHEDVADAALLEHVAHVTVARAVREPSAVVGPAAHAARHLESVLDDAVLVRCGPATMEHDRLPAFRRIPAVCAAALQAREAHNGRRPAHGREEVVGYRLELRAIGADLDGPVGTPGRRRRRR
eukprot:CAMPEP_0170282904 /NCGR_PEP_ID=MMETSP0116_2-20130129/41480_1 /TAXON_ID=400756 /ORGANISM="Durinskia baltica, Strain CSIRO CS-38" /LENGTH=271 /DNA_ID=CAMNT_0010534263 /DNA_START=335 /DNA_END=1148 /DNA_ORIENTATION=+